MKKRIKQGFTLVELVIVIAVIAILAAVLIPTFSNLITNAKNSADTQMVTNLNKYLASMEAIDGKNETMEEAMRDIVDAGYSAVALANANNDILWDITTDRVMAVYEKKTIASAENAKYDKKDTTGRYWAVAFEYDANTNYSYYLIAKTSIPTEVKYGLDISTLSFDGIENMPIITYIGTSTNVIFNGEFKAVTVKCEANAIGTIRLYGFVSELTLTEGNLEVNGFVVNLNEEILPNNESGSAEGSFTANNAKFYQTEEEINKIMEFKRFSDKGSKYGQHYFGKNNDLEKCTCCTENNMINPNHICVTGEPKTEERSDGTYLVIKCTICEKELVAYKLTEKCNGEHTLEDIYKKEATCTEPGYTIKWCTECIDYREIIEIPALGHIEQVGKGKEATCTEPGLTNGKYCSRCSTEENRIWTEPQTVISSLGHDYNRATGKCSRCGSDQPTTNIDADILHSSKIKVEKFGNFTSISFEGYEGYIDKVIFGYKEDYIYSINASKVEYEKEYDGVEVYAVYKKNENCGRQYGYEGAMDGQNPIKKDERDYLVDYYVLSDNRMCYVNNVDESNNYGFTAYLGYAVQYYPQENVTYTVPHLSGAVKEIRFENFDTSKTESFKQMFYLCKIQKLDLSGLVINSNVTFEDVFKYSDFKEVIYPAGWPEDVKADIITEGWE